MQNDLIGGMHFIVDKLDNMAIISASRLYVCEYNDPSIETFECAICLGVENFKQRQETLTDRSIYHPNAMYKMSSKCG